MEGGWLAGRISQSGWPHVFGTGNAYQVSLCADSSLLTPHQPQDPTPRGMCVCACLCGWGDNCMSVRVCVSVCVCACVCNLLLARWPAKLTVKGVWLPIFSAIVCLPKCCWQGIMANTKRRMDQRNTVPNFIDTHACMKLHVESSVWPSLLWCVCVWVWAITFVYLV